MSFIRIELLVRQILAVCALATLIIALVGLRGSSQRQIGSRVGSARSMLRWPGIVIATLLFIGIGILMGTVYLILSQYRETWQGLHV